ncbi:LysR family transcriptional regulator [Sinorhizobium alkalisoli]|uniref:LysR family transcriptional regulator n=1 Tax=Sinorhizobium alkalisoli TaxID=1752398 RepID=UPI00124DB755|nr:LysR family transcriptional regulator [Sinorhizobium alkalisoli]MCG5481528.1 LysR family transcriptional regulator [Sinorhizobium alkalisoli]QFI68891.1 Transcriptional regulator, LysR family protein [Sinorhizobium alkalisoli]
MDLEAGLELTQSFLIVAEELNFRRSAERLNVDQSALTRRIQKLEHLLGFALFERSTREVSLTPAGRRFYEENARLMHDYARSVKAARLVAEGKTGELRVAYMAFAATELMPNAVLRFRNAYPHVEVNLRYIRTQGQKLALADDEVDVGYMIGPFDHTDFHSLLLTSDPLYVVTPRNHALLHRPEIRPADLADYNLILGDMIEWEAYRWRLNEMFSAEGVPLNITLEASNTLALLGLVAAGLGVTVYPESLIGFLGRNVEVRPIMHPDFRIQTILVWKRSNRAKSVRHFVDIAKNLPPRI